MLSEYIIPNNTIENKLNYLLNYTIKQIINSQDIIKNFNTNDVDHIIIDENYIICIKSAWINKNPTQHDLIKFINISNTFSNYFSKKNYYIYLSKHELNKEAKELVNKLNNIIIIENNYSHKLLINDLINLLYYNGIFLYCDKENYDCIMI